MLTQQDLKDISALIDEKLKKAVSYLPTRDEFYTKMDELMGELKAMREEMTLVTGRVSEHTDELEDHDIRIKRVEKQLASS